MCSTAGYEVKTEATRSALTAQIMGLHVHCEIFGTTVGEPTVEYTRVRRCGRFGGRRLSRVDKACGSIHYDIRIDVEVLDEGLTTSRACRSVET